MPMRTVSKGLFVLCFISAGSPQTLSEAMKLNEVLLRTSDEAK